MQKHTITTPPAGKLRIMPPGKSAREISEVIKQVSAGDNVIRATPRSLSAKANLATCSGIYGIQKLIADGHLTVVSQAGLPDFVFLLHRVSREANPAGRLRDHIDRNHRDEVTAIVDSIKANHPTWRKKINANNA